MKKVLLMVAAVAMIAIVACGPSAEEKQKIEMKRIADSTEAAQRTADSLAALEASMMPVDTNAVVTETPVGAPATN